jgi:hypothetical protein
MIMMLKAPFPEYATFILPWHRVLHLPPPEVQCNILDVKKELKT